ncbi:MAG: hypothetical protein ABEK50_03350 [bacterium]
MKVKEGDLVKIDYNDERSGESMELVVKIIQIMDKILVKEPDEHSYLDGGHRPFLIEDDDIIEVVAPAEQTS